MSLEKLETRFLEIENFIFFYPIIISIFPTDVFNLIIKTIALALLSTRR